MIVEMSLPIDDEIERGVLAQLEVAGAPAALCASCLVAALQFDRQRLMGAIRRLLARRLIDAQRRRCTRCGEIGLAVRRLAAPSSSR